MNPTAPREGQTPVMSPQPANEGYKVPPIYPGMTPINAPDVRTQAPVNPQQAVPQLPDLHELQLNFNHGAATPDQTSQPGNVPAPDQNPQTGLSEAQAAWGGPSALGQQVTPEAPTYVPTAAPQPPSPDVQYVVPGTEPIPPAPAQVAQAPAAPPIPQTGLSEAQAAWGGPSALGQQATPPEAPAYAHVAASPPPMAYQPAPAEAPHTYTQVPAPVAPPPTETSFASMPPAPAAEAPNPAPVSTESPFGNASNPGINSNSEHAPTEDSASTGALVEAKTEEEKRIVQFGRDMSLLRQNTTDPDLIKRLDERYLTELDAIAAKYKFNSSD